MRSFESVQFLKLFALLLIVLGCAATSAHSVPESPRDMSCDAPAGHAALDSLDAGESPDCSINEPSGDSPDDLLARGHYAQHCRGSHGDALIDYLAAAEAGASCRAWINITSLTDYPDDAFDRAFKECGRCGDGGKTQKLSLNLAIEEMGGDGGCARALPLAERALAGPDMPAAANAAAVAAMCRHGDGETANALWEAYGDRLAELAAGIDVSYELRVVYELGHHLAPTPEGRAACAREAAAAFEGDDQEWLEGMRAAASGAGDATCPLSPGSGAFGQ